MPFRVPELYFFYPSPQEANYWVNIDSVADLKEEALLKQVSQFDPAEAKYRADWDPEVYKAAKEKLSNAEDRKDGHIVEPFRFTRHQ